MNTKITYLYRDAANWKKLNIAVVSGVITEPQKDIIMSHLYEGEYFIPRQVGLPELRFSKITDLDHCWFELSRNSFEATNESPTEIINVDELVQRFRTVQWDDNIQLG